MLTAPVLLGVSGFDPRLQLLHLEDAATAVVAAAAAEASACHNIAGEGVVLLSQAASLLGRRLLPLLPPAAAGLPLSVLCRLAGLDLGATGALCCAMAASSPPGRRGCTRRATAPRRSRRC